MHKLTSAAPIVKTTLKPYQRRTKLEDLLLRMKALTVHDYLQHLGLVVSQRQAERDLQQHKRLKAKGRTRARVYLVKTTLS